MSAKQLMRLQVEIPEDLYQDMVDVFGGSVSEIAARALKKVYGDAKLQKLVEIKQAEVKAEGERLTAELGL